MDNNKVFVKEFEISAINREEILRYFGAKEWTVETEKILEDCLLECRGKIAYKACWIKLPVKCENSAVCFPEFSLISEGLSKNLNGCSEAVIFGATLGTGIDFLVGKYGRISPVKGLMFQAIGTERIESFCDELCAYLSKETIGWVKQRFSPGYGDLPLDSQKIVFKTLDCARKIGLTLNESLLMSPTKSVTAIVGIFDDCREAEKHNCKNCKKEDCVFRRT